jgi:hypothetical protein
VFSAQRRLLLRMLLLRNPICLKEMRKMARAVAKAIEQKILQLHDLGMKPGALRNKIVNDGIESGSGESVAKSTVYRVLEIAGRITRAKGRGMGSGGKRGQAKYLRIEEALPVTVVDDTDASASFDPILDDPAPEPSWGPPSYEDLAESRRTDSRQTAELFSSSRITDISQFVVEANSALSPLEEQWQAHGELLRSLRTSLDSVRVLVDGITGKDSELARLKVEQANSKNEIRILNDQVAKWQRQALSRAFGRPDAGEDSLVDRR